MSKRERPKSDSPLLRSQDGIQARARPSSSAANSFCRRVSIVGDAGAFMVFLIGNTGNMSSARVEGDGHRPSATEEVLAFVVKIIGPHPIFTVGEPNTIALGALASTTESP